ncbi:protein kinase [Streptomyces sp. NPDC012510]|uniref:protein kinase domain-containing protein n=1 Tax=Streptomyces sp. NPDC012510 TaxID=3364838 RepID=UPI0036E86476
MKITGHFPSGSPALKEEHTPPPAADPYAAVRQQARGVKKDYALEKFPLPDGEGGMGIVHQAVHKPTNTVVAFKKPRSLRENLTARMLREIEVAQALGGNRHVMPVLDFSPRAEWFVMPLAQATAEHLQSQLQHDGQELRALVDAVAAALADAHRLDYLHRDIKPANILQLNGRWVLGDWGIVRRPRGQTTNPKRTGTKIGTAEFGAPELSIAPHHATPASDIYSLGKVIGWLLTGTDPQPNIPLLPPPGPWRSVVRHCCYDRRRSLSSSTWSNARRARTWTCPSRGPSSSWQQLRRGTPAPPASCSCSPPTTATTTSSTWTSCRSWTWTSPRRSCSPTPNRPSP